MTVYLVIFLPKRPYICRIYIGFWPTLETCLFMTYTHKIWPTVWSQQCMFVQYNVRFHNSVHCSVCVHTHRIWPTVCSLQCTWGQSTAARKHETGRRVSACLGWSSTRSRSGLSGKQWCAFLCRRMFVYLCIL